MANYGDISFGSVPIYAKTISPSKVPSNIKQKLGRDVAQIKVIGRSSQDWVLQINGVILGTTFANLATNRAALEALDDADTHAYVDGIHDGNFIVDPESLQFDDNGETHVSMYSYSVRLIEKK